tara:strand:+ start:932 stop:1138 length:207 start_codon:yes stop_codon:yes gene_type:complete
MERTLFIVKSRSEAIKILKAHGYTLKARDKKGGFKVMCHLLDPSRPQRYVGALHQYKKGADLRLYVYK